MQGISLLAVKIIVESAKASPSHCLQYLLATSIEQRTNIQNDSIIRIYNHIHFTPDLLPISHRNVDILLPLLLSNTVRRRENRVGIPETDARL